MKFLTKKIINKNKRINKKLLILVSGEGVFNLMRNFSQESKQLRTSPQRFKFKTKKTNILNNIFTGSPRPFGNDTTGNGMLYNYMPHATGTPGDFYGRTQTGKTGHKKKNLIKSFICV